MQQSPVRVSRVVWIRRLALIVAVLVGSMGCGGPDLPESAAPGDAATTVPAPYDPGDPTFSGVRRTSFYLPMRDGVQIAIDLYLPKGLGRGDQVPTIVNQTRYWRSAGMRWPFNAFLDRPEDAILTFVRHGYAYVGVDARGSGASYGTRPYAWSADETKDGAEVVDWIVAQPWSNGMVGTFGTSYEGTTAEFLVTNAHPAVKAAAPRFALFDAYDDIAFPGGVHLSWFTETWGEANATLDRNELPAWAGFLGRLMVTGVRPVDADRDGVLLAAAVASHAQNWDVHALALANPHRDDKIASGETIAVFSPSTYADRVDASGVPIYSYSGWFDGAYPHSAIKRHLTLSNPDNKLILGPWTHGGYYSADPSNPGVSRFDHYAELLKFFDHYLTGRDTGLQADTPVHYYTMVAERWNAAETWPPQATMTRYYFGPEGSLTRQEPTVAEGTDVYEVDYSHGTGHTSRWDSLMGQALVAYPDRAKQDRKLLVYESAPLERALEVTGHPLVTLHVTSTATDGAFFVYLEDVGPDGSVAYVTEGQLRALHRKIANQKRPYNDVVPYHSGLRADAAPLVPGDLAVLTFDLLPTSYLFETGHRIRVAVGGADTDHFAPVVPEPPTLTMFREAQRASHVALPVVSR